jgi:hypothetical protein
MKELIKIVGGYTYFWTTVSSQQLLILQGSPYANAKTAVGTSLERPGCRVYGGEAGTHLQRKSVDVLR